MCVVCVCVVPQVAVVVCVCVRARARTCACMRVRVYVCVRARARSVYALCSRALVRRSVLVCLGTKAPCTCLVLAILAGPSLPLSLSGMAPSARNSRVCVWVWVLVWVGGGCGCVCGCVYVRTYYMHACVRACVRAPGVPRARSAHVFMARCGHSHLQG